VAENRPTPRKGAGIREFLRYYVLASARWRGRTVAGIITEVKRKSTCNREIRGSGQLLIDADELRWVLRHLARRELMVPLRKAWRLTREGRRKLALYDKQKEKSRDGKDRAARVLLGWMEPLRAGKVLDVGTGTGYLAFQVADQGYNVLGIDSGSFDYSKNSIKTARQEARAKGTGVQFRKVSLEGLRRGRARFDYVVASQAVHCMRDQPESIKAIYKLLRPGGAFLCMDLRVGLKGFLAHGWHAFLALSEEEWKKLLSGCGFEEPSFRKVNDYLIVKARKPPSRGAGARARQRSA